MILIPASLTLISLTAGMFLLAKINKDNLGIFFKVIAYFIIVASFLNLACCALHCAMQLCNEKFRHEIMMQKNQEFKKENIGYDHSNMMKDHDCFNEEDKKNCMEFYMKGYSDGFCKKEHTEQKDSSYTGRMDKKEKR